MHNATHVGDNELRHGKPTQSKPNRHLWVFFSFYISAAQTRRVKVVYCLMRMKEAARGVDASETRYRHLWLLCVQL